MLKRFGLVTSWVCNADYFVMIIVVMSIYIFFSWCAGPLAHCTGRMFVGGEGALLFGGVHFLRSVGMPVGVAVNFIGT